MVHSRAMKGRRLEILVVGIAAAVAATAFGAWWAVRPAVSIELREPGADLAPDLGALATQAPLSGTLILAEGVAGDVGGWWPAFRGANRDGVAANGEGLLRQWAADEPAVLWSVEVGEGYAGAAIGHGRVYVIDYDRENQADALRCLSLNDGQEIWRYAYPLKVKRNHGMSRTVPAVTDRHVVSIGPKCHVLCVDALTGEFRWLIDLVAEHGTTVPQWYAGQCPLIDQGRVIIAPGGSALMMAVDSDSGQVVWQAPNPGGWKMTHSSIVPMELDGRRTYVYCGRGGVAGVAADDGSILWQTTQWRISIATVASPVIVPGHRVFLSGGYNAGSMMLQIHRTEDGYAAEQLFKLKAGDFGATQQTPIVYEGHIYGVRPDGQLTCLDFDGQIRWASGPSARFGLGPLLIADGLVYVMNDEGLLVLAEASPSQYHPLAQAQVLHGHDSWGPMALAAGRLIVRDLTTMSCLAVAHR